MVNCHTIAMRSAGVKEATSSSRCGSGVERSTRVAAFLRRSRRDSMSVTNLFYRDPGVGTPGGFAATRRGFFSANECSRI